MQITRIGLDLAKLAFQVHGVDEHGRVVLRKQLRRDQVAAFFARLEPCLIGMEACGSAHHWARKLQALGAGGAACTATRRRCGSLQQFAQPASAVRRPPWRRTASSSAAAS